MGFTEFIGKHKETVILLMLFLVMANIILMVDFIDHDPQQASKESYYYGHSGSRGDTDGSSTVWNRNLNCGMPQYDKVFWDRYAFFYLILSQCLFFVTLVILAALGIYLFFRTAGYGIWQSVLGAGIYGISIRFLGWLPIWNYGWELILLFLPWIAYTLRQLKNGAGMRFAAFFSALLLLSFLLFEREIIIYFLLAIIVYLFYSFVDMFEVHNGFRQYIKFLLLVLGGLFLAMAGVIFPYLPLMQSQNQSLLNILMELPRWRLAGIIMIVAGAFLLLRLGKKQLVLVLGTGGLILVIMYVLIYKLPGYEGSETRNTELELHSEVVDVLAADTTLFRLFPIGKTYLDNRWTVKTESIGGSDNYHLQRYREVINKCLAVETDKNLHINWNLLRLLNVKYVVSAVKVPSWRVKYTYYSPSEQLILYQLLEPPQYAWFAQSREILPQEQILYKLSIPEFEPYATVYLENEILGLSDSTATIEPVIREIKIDTVTAENIRLIVKNNNPELLVLSEIFDENSHWEAFIDNLPATIYPANYFLRSLVIPPGDHILELRYNREMLEKYQRFSYCARILILLLLVEEVFYLIIRKRRGFVDR